MKKISLSNMATFGVAGNFTGHLEQAGEDKDFLSIKTPEASAPKAIFPTYLPENTDSTQKAAPEFLHIFPFDSSKIIFPKNEIKLQIEPECGIIFNVKWSENKIEELIPLYFGASNDCSIRKEGASKISQKKNWGNASKGFADKLIPIDVFSEKGIINKYNIASFIKRKDNVFVYGENSCIKDYSYIYEKLINWMKDKLNNQENTGPAEKLNDYLLEAGKPEQIMISIGATRYTDFGEHNFLEIMDKTYVVLYPSDQYTPEDIFRMVQTDDLNYETISALVQTVYTSE